MGKIKKNIVGYMAPGAAMNKATAHFHSSYYLQFFCIVVFSDLRYCKIFMAGSANTSVMIHEK